MSSYPQILKAFGWAFLGKGAAAFYALAVNALIARLLEPQLAGGYFLVASFVGFGTILATLGTPQIMVRQIAIASTAGEAKLLRSVFRRIFLLVVIGCFLVLCVFPSLVGPRLTSLFGLPATSFFLVVIACWIAANAILRTYSEAFRGLNDIRTASIFSGMNFGGLIGGGLLCLSLGALLLTNSTPSLETVSVLSMAAVVVALITAAVFWVVKLKSLSGSGGQFCDNETHGLKPLLLASLPMLVTMLFNYFITMGDIWLLGMVRSGQDVALYAAAGKLAMVVNIPFMIVNAVVPPLIATHYAARDLNRVEPLLRGVALIALLPALGFGLVFLVGGKGLLGLVYGDYYMAAFVPLLILTIGQIGNVWAGSCAVVMAMANMERQLMMNTAVSAVALATGGLVLGYYFGVLGVACCFAAVNVTRNVVMVVTIRATLGIWCQSSLSLAGIKDAFRLVVSKDYVKP